MAEYMDPLIASQPLDTDPQEREIKQKLDREIMSGEFAKTTLPKLRDMQAVFFKLAFNNLNDSQLIMEKYRKLVPELKDTSNTKIVSGVEHLSDLAANESFIIVTNHLGIIKLTPIENSDHRYPVPLDKFEPFPLRHAPFSIISEKLGTTLYETAVQLPASLSQIQEACNVITITPSGGGGTDRIIQQIESLKKNEKPAAIVMYPEGGTSGKRNNGGPYDLDTFHTGTFVIAAKTGLPVLPVTQFFNPSKGYELTILPPIKLNAGDLDKIKTITENIKFSMQKALDSLTISK